MLTDSELDAIRLETINVDEQYLWSHSIEFAPWIGRLIRTEADARLLLRPIEVNLMDDELVEFKDGTKSTRLERIDFLLQCWDDPAKMDYLEEAADLIEHLTEVTMIDLGSEWYQPAHDVLVAIGCPRRKGRCRHRV